VAALQEKRSKQADFLETKADTAAKAKGSDLFIWGQGP